MSPPDARSLLPWAKESGWIFSCVLSQCCDRSQKGPGGFDPSHEILQMTELKADARLQCLLRGRLNALHGRTVPNYKPATENGGQMDASLHIKDVEFIDKLLQKRELFLTRGLLELSERMQFRGVPNAHLKCLDEKYHLPLKPAELFIQPDRQADGPILTPLFVFLALSLVNILKLILCIFTQP